MRLPNLPLLAALCFPATAQQSISYTRVFDGEVVPITNPISPSANGLGVGAQVSSSDGFPLAVVYNLELRYQFELECTNNTGVAGNFRYFQPGIYYAPNASASCSSYMGAGLFGGPVFAEIGETVVLSVDITHSLQWSGNAFEPLCASSEPWDWANLLFNTNYYQDDVLVGPDWGPHIPNILQSQVTVNGTVTAEWVPNLLDHFSVCPGLSDYPTTLYPAGGPTQMWLLQTGAPADKFHLFLRSPTASSIVPPDGLCINQGGGPTFRLGESLSIGGQPFFFGFHPALSGSNQFFQGWFRTDNGPQTTECIVLTLP